MTCEGDRMAVLTLVVSCDCWAETIGLADCKTTTNVSNLGVKAPTVDPEDLLSLIPEVTAEG